MWTEEETEMQFGRESNLNHFSGRVNIHGNTMGRGNFERKIVEMKILPQPICSRIKKRAKDC